MCAWRLHSHGNEVEKVNIVHNGHKVDETEGDAACLNVVLLKSRDSQKGKVICVMDTQILNGY